MGARGNLADEQGHPEAHLDLFDRFAAALPTSARATGPGPAATALVETYRALAECGPVAALSGLAAYETQAAAIAASKADGLHRWYGMDDAGTAFWDVHAAMDADHGDWAVRALVDVGADAEAVADGAAGVQPTRGGRCSTSGRPRPPRPSGSLRARSRAQPRLAVPTTETNETISPG